MMSLLSSILSVLLTAEFVLGNFVNVFIALVNCIDWVKRRKISCTDGILTALAVSRIGLLWITVLNWYVIMFYPAFHSSGIRTVIYIAWAVSNHFSLWLATSLSILYLLKIANFSSLLFLHLKWQAKRVVLVILSGTLVILVCHLAVVSTDEKMQMKQYERNISWDTNLSDPVHLADMIIFTLTNFIPFTMSLAAFLLLIFSLWKHLKKMQLSGKGCQDFSTKVHVRAMQMVISFLLLFVIYCLTIIISSWSLNSLQNGPVFLFSQVISMIYPLCHSFILIWGNKKLNQDFLSVLWQVRCGLKKWKSSTP